MVNPGLQKWHYGFIWLYNLVFKIKIDKCSSKQKLKCACLTHNNQWGLFLCHTSTFELLQEPIKGWFSHAKQIQLSFCLPNLMCSICSLITWTSLFWRVRLNCSTWTNLSAFKKSEIAHASLKRVKLNKSLMVFGMTWEWVIDRIFFFKTIWGLCT